MEISSIKLIESDILELIENSEISYTENQISIKGEEVELNDSINIYYDINIEYKTDITTITEKETNYTYISKLELYPKEINAKAYYDGEEINYVDIEDIDFDIIIKDILNE